jgi:protein-S-isoprenylcysteine O-methyltransferase Ste14
MIHIQLWPTLAFVTVILCWLTFAASFLFHKKPPSPPDKKRDPWSIVGIALQGAGYAIVWVVRRAWFTPILSLGKLAEIAVAIVAMVLAAGSVWLCISAIRTLGQQWSLAARVVEGHELVTQGPYSVVRNPIYTGMLGMLLATGLAVSHWLGLLIGLVVFSIGTAIRVRTEAALLRETFGEEFEEYSRRVPAVIPYVI